MPKIIFTPWRDLSELLDVRSAFYPPETDNSELDLREWACQKVGVWKLRGNLPNQVEATALLTNAILHDDGTKNSIFSIRATYAAAFCRFVTGLVDSKLHGKRKTMFQRATDLGLPASFVEIRHEATHRELPSLVVLRSSTHRSLEWLWEFYWCKLDANLALLNYSQLGMAKSPSPHILSSSSPATTGIDQSLRSKIRDYVLQLHGIDRGEQTQIAKRKEARRLGLFLSQPLVAICRGHHEARDVLSQVLLEKNLVVPVQRPNKSSPQEVFFLWDPLLISISEHCPSFFNQLVEELLNNLIIHRQQLPSMGTEAEKEDKVEDDKDDEYLDSLYMWLKHMLTSSHWKGPRKQLSLSYMIATCNVSANRWTELLAEDLRSISEEEDQLHQALFGNGDSGDGDVKEKDNGDNTDTINHGRSTPMGEIGGDRKFIVGTVNGWEFC